MGNTAQRGGEPAAGARVGVSTRRRRARRAVAALIMTLAAVAASPAAAENRVALVIGNGGYQAAPVLANPPNDAKDVGEALKSLGFKVTLGTDFDQAKMKRAIEDFSKTAAAADVSLFYYGGHGLQIAAHNYLIPVDAQLHSLGDIDKRTIHFDDLLDALAKGAGVHLVFLDACRNNPLKDANIALPSAGLARVGNAAGFLIAFATQPDNVAFDGAGRNSPFAQALLGRLATAGVDISNMMIEVRRDVIASTGGAQIPWENSSLTRQFYFAGEAASEDTPETQLWRLAGGQRDPSLLSVYLERYPDGSHAADVRKLLANLGAGAPTPTMKGDFEETLWLLARGARQRKLVELYLARFPGGAHAPEAKELVASLREGESDDTDPGVVCARLATHPRDATADMPGVDGPELADHAREAIGVCGEAAAQHPEIAHYVALLARANAAAGRYDEAYALFRKAADAGDTRAMVSLGLMLEDGDHAPKDVAAAYALYQKAAMRGSADGAINLALALIDGKGIEKDVARAYALLQQASQMGSAIATYDLAKIALAGRFGKPADALDLFKKSAIGLPEGYRAAAILLDAGHGVPRDADAAADLMLRCVAADSGECLGELSVKGQAWTAETIKAIETRLRTAGYYAGPIDGKTGPALAPGLTQWRLLGSPPKS